ncbi:MAG: hypothetical protein ACKOCE_07165 [Acidimicrobiia bacterium]
MGHAGTGFPADESQNVAAKATPDGSDTENDTVTVPPTATDDGDTPDT